MAYRQPSFLEFTRELYTYVTWRYRGPFSVKTRFFAQHGMKIKYIITHMTKGTQMTHIRTEIQIDLYISSCNHNCASFLRDNTFMFPQASGRLVFLILQITFSYFGRLERIILSSLDLQHLLFIFIRILEILLKNWLEHLYSYNIWSVMHNSFQPALFISLDQITYKVHECQLLYRYCTWY